MSNWEDFKTDASKIASKVAAKTGELADAAALRIRQQTLKLHLSEQYEKLGRMAYTAARTEEQPDTAATLESIDTLIAQLEQLEQKMRQE